MKYYTGSTNMSSILVNMVDKAVLQVVHTPSTNIILLGLVTYLFNNLHTSNFSPN